MYNHWLTIFARDYFAKKNLINITHLIERLMDMINRSLFSQCLLFLFFFSFLFLLIPILNNLLTI